MRRIFKTIEDHLTECTTLEKGVWVHLQSPTKEEVDGLTTRFNLDPTFLPAALDEEESARIDYDSDKQQTLIIVDIPYVDTEGTGYVYSTIPLGIVLCDEVIITVCTRDTPIINDFTEERIRNFWTFKRTRFILQILQRNAGRFLSYLKQIDKTSQHIQEKLEHTSRNQELLQMMKLEKSLVYFNTSLRGNEVLISRLRHVFTDGFDLDLLEDVEIELKQALNTVNIYTEILAGTLDTYASVISNNVNMIMKRMTGTTIILMIPTLIASFYGMNVSIGLADVPGAFWIIVATAALLTLVTYLLLKHLKWF